MPRITPIDQNNIDPILNNAFEKYSIEYRDGISNMKATLGYSLPAFDAYLQWHPLYESVKKILGERLATVYAYTISKASNCYYCDTVFRKKLIELGENPDKLILDAKEKSIIDFAFATTQCYGNIANHIFNSVAAYFSKEDLVTLIAFAGQMIAANIFNNVVETELDTHLQQYTPVTKSIWE